MRLDLLLVKDYHVRLHSIASQISHINIYNILYMKYFINYQFIRNNIIIVLYSSMIYNRGYYDNGIIVLDSSTDIIYNI